MTSQGGVGRNAVLTIGITMPAGYSAKTGVTRPLPNPNSDLRRVFFNCQLAHLLIKKAATFPPSVVFFRWKTTRPPVRTAPPCHFHRRSGSRLCENPHADETRRTLFFPMGNPNRTRSLTSGSEGGRHRLIGIHIRGVVAHSDVSTRGKLAMD
jgi:hypothetical protein